MTKKTNPFKSDLTVKFTEPGSLFSKLSRDEDEQQIILTKEWVLSEIELAKKAVFSDAEKEIVKQVQLDKASLFTVFGIFASIISFLTIEFQFLKTVCSFDKILGFTLILFTLLFSFNLALDYLVKSRLDDRIPKPNVYFLIMILILFGVGCYFSVNGNEEICKDGKIYQKYSDDFDNKYIKDQKELKEIIDSQKKKIEDLEQKINKIDIKEK